MAEESCVLCRMLLAVSPQRAAVKWGFLRVAGVGNRRCTGATRTLASWSTTRSSARRPCRPCSMTWAPWSTRGTGADAGQLLPCPAHPHADAHCRLNFRVQGLSLGLGFTVSPCQPSSAQHCLQSGCPSVLPSAAGGYMFGWMLRHGGPCLTPCRFNLGTADELALDVLINSLSTFSRE